MGSPLQLAAAVFVLAAAAAAGATLGVYAVDRLMEFLWPMRYGRRRRPATAAEVTELYSAAAKVWAAALGAERPAAAPDATLTMPRYAEGRAGVPRGPR